jgi:hypothetical protein
MPFAGLCSCGFRCIAVLGMPYAAVRRWAGPRVSRGLVVACMDFRGFVAGQFLDCRDSDGTRETATPDPTEPIAKWLGDFALVEGPPTGQHHRMSLAFLSGLVFARDGFAWSPCPARNC